MIRYNTGKNYIDKEEQLIVDKFFARKFEKRQTFEVDGVMVEYRGYKVPQGTITPSIKFYPLEDGTKDYTTTDAWNEGGSLQVLYIKGIGASANGCSAFGNEWFDMLEGSKDKGKKKVDDTKYLERLQAKKLEAQAGAYDDAGLVDSDKDQAKEAKKEEDKWQQPKPKTPKKKTKKK